MNKQDEHAMRCMKAGHELSKIFGYVPTFGNGPDPKTNPVEAALQIVMTALVDKATEEVE